MPESDGGGTAAVAAPPADNNGHPCQQWPVLVACFVCHMTTGSVSYHAGVLHVALLETFDRDVVSTAWLGAVYSSLPSLVGPLASLLVTLYDCRTCLVLSGLLAAAGAAGCFLVTDFLLLYPALALAAVGQGLSLVATYVAIGYHFPRHASLLTGICVCGSGLGIFIHPPLLQALVGVYGVQGAMLVVGAVSLHAVPCGLAVAPSPYELQRRRARQGQRERERHNLLYDQFPFDLGNLALLWLGVTARQTGLRQTLWGPGRTLTGGRFLLLLLTGLTFSAAVSSYYLYLPDFLRHHRYEGITASLVLSVTGVGSIPARLLTGVALADERVDALTFFFSTFALASLTALLVPLTIHSLLAQMVLGALFGTYTGATWTCCSPLLLEVLGVSRVASGVGLYLFTVGVGYLAGPPLAAAIYAVTGRFQHVFYFSGAMFALATVAGMLSGLTSSPVGSPDQPLQTDGRYCSRSPLRFTVHVKDDENRDSKRVDSDVTRSDDVIRNGARPTCDRQVGRVVSQHLCEGAHAQDGHAQSTGNNSACRSSCRADRSFPATDREAQEAGVGLPLMGDKTVGEDYDASPSLAVTLQSNCSDGDENTDLLIPANRPMSAF